MSVAASRSGGLQGVTVDFVVTAAATAVKKRKSSETTVVAR